MTTKCKKCNGDGYYMKETPIEDRSYSSTSSGEFNGPYSVKCDWCYGTGILIVKGSE